jgi:hypothetical protein
MQLGIRAIRQTLPETIIKKYLEYIFYGKYFEYNKKNSPLFCPKRILQGGNK